MLVPSTMSSYEEIEAAVTAHIKEQRGVEISINEKSSIQEEINNRITKLEKLSRKLPKSTAPAELRDEDEEMTDNTTSEE